jgi:hypothetical protein
VGRDDFDEDFLEVVLAVFFAKLSESAFGKKLTGLDDANGVAEFFDFGHDVCGEDDGFARVATFANKRNDRPGSHDVKSIGGLVKDHDWRVMDKRASNGSLLFLASRELIATTVAELPHIEAFDDVFDAFVQGGFIEAIQASEILDHFLRCKPGIKCRGGREKANIGANFFGLLEDVVAGDDGGAVGRFKDSGEHAEGGGFAGAVGTKEAINLAGMAGEADVIDGADLAAFLVLEVFGQGTSFDHGKTSRWTDLEQATVFSSYYVDGWRNVTRGVKSEQGANFVRVEGDARWGKAASEGEPKASLYRRVEAMRIGVQAKPESADPGDRQME